MRKPRRISDNKLLNFALIIVVLAVVGYAIGYGVGLMINRHNAPAIQAIQNGPRPSI